MENKEDLKKKEKPKELTEVLRECQIINHPSDEAIYRIQPMKGLENQFGSD